MTFLQKDDEDNKTWGTIEEKRIFHKQDITSVLSISDEILLTYSQLDQVIKIWKLEGEECNCMNEIKLKNKAISIQFDSISQCLAIMDDQCQIGAIQRDFVNNKELSGAVSMAGESDINLEDYEMADLDDPEEEEDKKISVSSVIEKKDLPVVAPVPAMNEPVVLV